MATQKTDVVIVGVGAAGGILAAELGKAGIKVIGLERGPRLQTSDFEAHDELRFFQRQDLRPDPKRMPVTWRPNTNATAHPIPSQNNGNEAGGGTVHYGALSWRFHEDDFRVRSATIERYGASAIPADSSVIDWPLSYADLEPYYERAEYELGVSGKAGNLDGKKIDGGNVFESSRKREYPLKPLLIDQVGVNFTAGSQEAWAAPVLLAACDPVGALQGSAGLHLLRLLPGIWLPRRRQVLDPGHQAAGGRRHRQFQADHRCHVLSRQQRQQRQGDRRVVLRPGRLRQHDRGRSRHPGAVHLRQRAPVCCYRRRRNSRTGSPIRAATSASTSWRISARAHSRHSTTATSTSIWGRARRRIRSTISTATISITRIWASSAARRSRPAQPASKAARSAPRWHEPAARRAALGRRLSRLSCAILHAPRRDDRADGAPALRRPDRSTSIPMCATPGACRRRA